MRIQESRGGFMGINLSTTQKISFFLPLKNGTALHIFTKPSCASCPIPNSRKRRGNPMKSESIVYTTKKGTSSPLLNIVCGSL